MMNLGQFFERMRTQIKKIKITSKKKKILIIQIGCKQLSNSWNFLSVLLRLKRDENCNYLRLFVDWSYVLICVDY